MNFNQVFFKSLFWASTFVLQLAFLFFLDTGVKAMETNGVPSVPNPLSSPVPSPVSSDERLANLLKVLKAEADKGDVKYALQYGKQLLQRSTSNSANFNEGLNYVFEAAVKGFQPAVDYLIGFATPLFRSAADPIEKKYRILDHLIQLDVRGSELIRNYLVRNSELIFEVGRASVESPTEMIFQRKNMGLKFIGVSARLHFKPAADFIGQLEKKLDANLETHPLLRSSMSEAVSILISDSERLPTPNVELENVKARGHLSHAERYNFWVVGRFLLASVMKRVDSGKPFGRLGYESLRILRNYPLIDVALNDYKNTLSFQGHKIFSSPELNTQEKEDILRWLFDEMMSGTLEATRPFDEIFYLESKKPIEQQNWGLLRRIEGEFRSYFNPLCDLKNDVDACFILGTFELTQDQYQQAEKHLRFGLNKGHSFSFYAYTAQVALELPYFNKDRLIARRGDFLSGGEIDEFNALLKSPIAVKGLLEALSLVQAAEKSGSSGIERGLENCVRAENFYRQIVLSKNFRNPVLDARQLEAEKQYREVQGLKEILLRSQKLEIEKKAIQDQERRAKESEWFERERERAEQYRVSRKATEEEVLSRARHSLSGVSAELIEPKYSWRLLSDLAPAEVNAQFPLDTLPPFPSDDETNWIQALTEAGGETSPFSTEERSGIRRVSWSFEGRYLVRYLFAVKIENEAGWNVHDFESRLYRYLFDWVNLGIGRASAMAGAGCAGAGSFLPRTPSPKERAPTPEEGGAGVTREWNVQVSEEFRDYLDDLMRLSTGDSLILLRKLRKTLADLKANPYSSSLNSHKLEGISFHIFESYVENHISGARRIFWVKSKYEGRRIVVLFVREHLKDGEATDALFSRFFDFSRLKPSVEIPESFWIEEGRSQF